MTTPRTEAIATLENVLAKFPSNRLARWIDEVREGADYWRNAGLAVEAGLNAAGYNTDRQEENREQVARIMRQATNVPWQW
jgi:hypothetical protein